MANTISIHPAVDQGHETSGCELRRRHATLSLL